MVVWLWLVIVNLICIVDLLSGKIFFMHRAAKEMVRELSAILNEDTNVLISISCRDRHMRRLASSLNGELKKLRADRHRFQQGDTELKNAVTNISHDLRTPLTAISGYLELLDGEEKSETVTHYTDIIRNRTEMLKKLTEELFRYSVITSEEYDDEEAVSVNMVLEESILGYYAALRESDITPVVHMPQQKVIRTVNRAALARIFSNLINNAMKYSDGDLDIRLTEKGEIIFSNAAAGLDEVQVNRLFDRFYTVETGRRSTGLGLSIAKLLTERMGGRISAEYRNSRLYITVVLEEQVQGIQDVKR